MNTVWSRDNCGWCDKAKELLDNYGFEYEVKDVYENKEEFRREFPDAKTVPQVIFNGEKVGGYADLHQVFEEQNIFFNGGRHGTSF